MDATAGEVSTALRCKRYLNRRQRSMAEALNGFERLQGCLPRLEWRPCSSIGEENWVSIHKIQKSEDNLLCMNGSFNIRRGRWLR
eukprot:4195810-Prymnesium_polylepis.1